MSSPINSISGSGATNWLPTADVAPNNPGGPSFAQVAAAAGLTAQPGNSGSGQNGGASGTGSTTGTGQPSSGQTGLGGLGGFGAAGQNTGGVATGQSGITQNAAPTFGTGATGATGAAPSNSTGAAGSATGSGGTGSSNVAALSGTDTFLKLLVAQLKNQDPTSPMDDSTFVTELAQFNSVEQMINLNQAIATQTTTTQANEGIAMLGRSVTYTNPGVGGNAPVSSQGTVTGVSLAGGQVELRIGAQQVALSEVTAVTG